MKKKTKLILTLLVIVVTLGVAIVGFKMITENKNDKVIAKVNGEKIYQSELETRLSRMFQNREQKIAVSDIPAGVLEALVQDVYLQRELDKIAKKSSVASSKEVSQQIEDYKSAVIRQAYLDSIIKEKVTDEAVKNKYSEISSELTGKREMHLKHILVVTEEDAKKVSALLKKNSGAFAKLAKEYSKDAANARTGGDLGYVIPDNLDEDFAKAVSVLKKGQISDPIKTKFGWHIVKLEAVRDVDVPAFETIKTTVENNLRQEIIEGIFTKITKDAKVKILIPVNEQAEPLTNVIDTTVKESESEAELEAKSDNAEKK